MELCIRIRVRINTRINTRINIRISRPFFERCVVAVGQRLRAE